MQKLLIAYWAGFEEIMVFNSTGKGTSKDRTVIGTNTNNSYGI